MILISLSFLKFLVVLTDIWQTNVEIIVVFMESEKKKFKPLWHSAGPECFLPPPSPGGLRRFAEEAAVEKKSLGPS